jgi:serine/threonine protein kinase
VYIERLFLERFGKDIVLLEKLASGGMAEVYRGKHLGFGGFEKTVAIKRILPSFANNDEFKEMFRQEANLSAHLQNPNIVQIFSNGEFNGYLYLVMEFVNGKNVRQLISRAEKMRKKIPIEIACYMVAEASKGLDYAHNFHDEKTGEELNIIHRDMSPQNIMVGYDGSVKIVDFGIAKAASRAEGTKAGVLKGKFGYMSPEQAQGMKLDRRTDVFSMGIILWELLTQKRLFSTDDDLQTLQLVRECNIMKPSKKNPLVTYGLDKIVMKALAKERSERYSTAGELYGDLQRYLNEKHSDFIPTNFSKFTKELFAEVIEQEKKKREQINLQAPPILAEPRGQAHSEDVKSEGDNKDRTKIDNDEITQLSVSVVQDSKIIKGEELPPSLDMKAVGELSVARDMSHEPVVSQGSAISAPSDFAETFELTKTGAKKGVLNNNFGGNLSMSKDSYASKPKRNNRIKVYAVAILFIVLAVGISKKAKFSNLTKNNNESLAVDNTEVTQNDPIENKENPVDVEGAVTSTEPAREPGAPASEVPEAGRKPGIVESGPASGEPYIKTPEPEAEEAQTPVVENPSALNNTPAVNNPPAVAVTQTPAPSLAQVPNEAPQETAKANGGVISMEGERSPSSLPGYIELRSTPTANEIFIDGKALVDKKGQPQSTPVRNLKLKPGRRQVRLVNRAFGAYWEGVIEVESDRLIKKDVILVNKVSR